MEPDVGLPVLPCVRKSRPGIRHAYASSRSSVTLAAGRRPCGHRLAMIMALVRRLGGLAQAGD
jgi:hypothetical protein